MAISAFYSFGGSHGEESRFIRRGIFAIVAVSSIVALWGLLSVLSPQIGQTEVRARGPFINADHFANYLGMMAPLALAGVLYPGSYVKGSWCDPFRIIAGVAFLVTSSAIFVSLSRAGWIIWTLGCLLLIGSTVLSRRSAEPGDAFEVRPAVGSRTRIIIGFGAVLLFLVAVSLVLGDRGQRLLGQRITDTMSNEASFTGRTEVWRASLPMLRDFPVVGVGLGVWPDIFDRYQQPPYDGRFFWGAAHNDYLQFAIETGIVGTGLLLWFWSQLAAHLIRSRSVLNSRAIPMYMALLAGMAAMAAHEMADFSFRTTANAVLFCVLAGFALRISQKRNPTQVDRLNRSWKLSTLAAGLSALTVVFLTTQPAVAYPEQVYSTESRAYWQSPAQAIPALVQLIAEHPGRADPHLAMIHSLGLEKKWTEIDREIDAAMWLEPISPIARDWHAYRLERSGRVQEAFAEITRSVMQSPRLETHDSLKKQNLERLGPGEKHAVEMGLQQAVAGGYAEAVPQLAEYYSLSNRHIDEAELYLRTAGQQPESSQQERFLLAAGEAFEQAGDDRKAKSTFEMAAKIAPSDAGPYLGLISVADGPTKDMAGAQAAVGIGIRNGVDPVVLYSALAETAQLANRSEIASAALAKVVEYAPTFQNNLHLADFYLATGKADRAVDTLRKVTMIAPDSAEAYVRLATAEEAAYLYADADRDYSHALSLEPNNAEAKSRYAEFQHRTADKGTSAMGDPGN